MKAQHLDQGPAVLAQLVVVLELHSHCLVAVDGRHLHVGRVVHDDPTEEVSGSET